MLGRFDEMAQLPHRRFSLCFCNAQRLDCAIFEEQTARKHVRKMMLGEASLLRACSFGADKWIPRRRAIEEKHHDEEGAVRFPGHRRTRRS